MFFIPSEMKKVVIDVAKVIERTFQIQNICFYSMAIIFFNQCYVFVRVLITFQFYINKI